MTISIFGLVSIMLANSSPIILVSLFRHFPEAGDFKFPTGVTFHPLGYVVVVDRANSLQIFDKTGSFLEEITAVSYKEVIPSYKEPNFENVLQINRVIIHIVKLKHFADLSRLKRFNDFNQTSEFTILFLLIMNIEYEFNQQMNTDLLGQLKNPNGVAVDKAGYFFVADSSKHRIAVYSPS